MNNIPQEPRVVKINGENWTVCARSLDIEKILECEAERKRVNDWAQKLALAGYIKGYRKGVDKSIEFINQRAKAMIEEMTPPTLAVQQSVDCRLETI